MTSVTPPDWAHDAEALMERARTADWTSAASVQPVQTAIGEFCGRFGDRALKYTLVEWVKHAMFETRHEPGESHLSFDPVGADGEPLPSEEVLPGRLWAARFIAAGFDGDLDEQRALVAELFSEFSTADFTSAIVSTLRITSAMVRDGKIVREWTPTTPPMPPWVAEADAVLDAAALDQWEGEAGVRVLLQAFADRHGSPVVVKAMEHWCLQWGQRARAEAGADATAPAFPEWRAATTCEEVSVEDVAPAQRWAGRFMTAVNNDDLPQKQALLGSLSTNNQFSECVIAILEATSSPVTKAR